MTSYTFILIFFDPIEFINLVVLLRVRLALLPQTFCNHSPSKSYYNNLHFSTQESQTAMKPFGGAIHHVTLLLSAATCVTIIHNSFPAHRQIRHC